MFEGEAVLIQMANIVSTGPSPFPERMTLPDLTKAKMEETT
jgi:hypothetical protein